MARNQTQSPIVGSCQAWLLIVLLGGLPGCGSDSTAQNSRNPSARNLGAPTERRERHVAAALVTSAEEVSVPVPSAAEPVTAVMTIQPSHATAGETVEVLVRVRIASAHFIHAPGEAGGPFIPVSVNATFPAGLEPIGDWQLPPPEKGRGSAVVYRDSVVLRRFVNVVASSGPSALNVTGELRYQVCTDELCWPQGKLQLSAPFTIQSPRR